MDAFPEPTGVCEKCGQRPASTWFAGGGFMDFIHGLRQAYCERCTVEEQLQFAEEMAAKIPELKAKLAELDAMPPLCTRSNT